MDFTLNEDQQEFHALLRQFVDKEIVPVARDWEHEGRYPVASTTSSKFFSPGFGALTSTAKMPGLCWFFHIMVCAFGMSSNGSTSLMQG